MRCARSGYRISSLGGVVDMCLAVPARIVRILDHDQALVDVGGVLNEISLTGR
ncbi:MAG: HypC/HybG/HupF family hydrogenase formation chaperone [Acidiferrobacterales bacterium]